MASQTSPVDVSEGSLAFRLLDEFQRGWPLKPSPFAAVAAALHSDEARVLALLSALRLQGHVSRIGAVVAPGRVGASTLAALAVPPERLDAVAAQVSALHEVNHNYARAHRYNLWFVLTAPDAAALQAALARIEALTGLKPLDLPLEREIHIDLGFALRSGERQARTAAAGAHPRSGRAPSQPERAVLAALADGLPLVARPYAQLAEPLGMGEADVIAQIEAMLGEGIIKRFGVVVRHHELGYAANAMVVWNIADAQVDAVADRLACEAAVTLCYRRPRRPPDWPYNLFCMVHGQAHDAVRVQVEGLANIASRMLGQRPEHELLFSTVRYKQRGARYGAAAEGAPA